MWVSDITYILTDDGWRYLTVILDLADRAVVGWVLSETMHAQCTVIPALMQAIQKRRIRPNCGLLFHSDRGVQYACDDLRKILTRYGITQSMSRKGNCWDNAPTESWFNSFKNEWVHGIRYATHADMKATSFEYIEVFYNLKRQHSTLGYRSPIQFLENWLTEQQLDKLVA